MDNKGLATFGGGCFWCTEAIFKNLKGVMSVMPGYAGGETKNPTYEQVIGGDTGHAEVIQIEFDPSVIPYERLLDVFFSTHDPTTVNRQGNDVGEQYRSVIFYHSHAQRATCEQIINQLKQEKTFDRPIITQLAPYTNFYPAEDYHRDYYAKNSGQPYCQTVISPKIAKLKEKFKPYLK